MAAVTWSTTASQTTGIAAQTINNAAGVLGSSIDNSSTKARFIDLQLTTTHGSAPTAGRSFLFYFIESADATNYEDGDASTQPMRAPDAKIEVRAVTTAQVITVKRVPLSPFKFKILAWNDTGVNSGSTAVTVLGYTYNELLP